ncbi:MAG: hypothetical protein E7091_08780 [Bacteroidales bacterium]|nr:hypothetical protein [Bacteroidales bacterium]
MKKVINFLLLLCVCGVGYISVMSIVDDINFNDEMEARNKVVIARLIDIKKAQEAFRDQNKGQYTDNFDELINFIKTGKLATVKKVGTLTDKQLEDGLTEAKVIKMIDEAKKAKPAAAVKKWKELDSKGIVRFNEKGGDVEFLFSRDTMWVAILDTLYPEGFNADSIRFVPFGNGKEFEMRTGCDSSSKSGNKLYLFEAKTPYDVYLNGLNKDAVFNLTKEKEKLGRYAGLKVGDAEVGNQNAGNWE